MSIRELLHNMARGALWGLIVGVSWCVVFFAGAATGVQWAKEDHPQCFEVAQ